MAQNLANFSDITRCFDQNIEEHCIGLNKFTPRIKQLSEGYFQGRATTVDLGDCTLLRLSTAPRHSLTFRPAEEAFFVFPLNGDSFFANGRIYHAQRQLASPGDREVHAIFPENLDYLIITIPLAALQKRLQAEEYTAFMDTLEVFPSLRADEHKKQAATADLHRVVARIEGSGTRLTRTEAGEYSRLIVTTLLGFVASHQTARHVRPSNHEKVLQRALALIESNPRKLLTLDEIAREAFASKRSVQYAFSSLLGLSPMRYIKLTRLNLIRQELLQPNNAANFSRVMAKYGFSNASRMAREYEDFFGERPRDTCRQQCAECMVHTADLTCRLHGTSKKGTR